MGCVRRGMFTKLKTAKYLGAYAVSDAAEVIFIHGVQRLSRVHHLRLRDGVSRLGPMVKYAENLLSGMNSDVESIVRETLLCWLSQ